MLPVPPGAIQTKVQINGSQLNAAWLVDSIALEYTEGEDMSDMWEAVEKFATTSQD